MGTVWVAKNTVLEVNVAIKLITLTAQHDGDDTAERLLREARAAARLHHAAIVRVFDFGRTRHGDPFIVMELLHGESVAEVLDRASRMSAVETVRAMLPIAEALASAHDKGVVHRDVKPENVILATTEEGRTQPKLLDFGIASLQEQSTRITQEKRLTREGSVVGTPAYMSPEQAMGKNDLDQRTDVWSFGVMIYELTTGRLPFDADNYNALLYEIINCRPEPCTAHGAGDSELWGILEVALRKQPEERWGSMRAFGEALALWLVDQGISEDICAASLRSSWLDSSAAPEPEEGEAPISGKVRQRHSRTPLPAPVPLPSKPPRRTTKVSGTRLRQRWPLRLAFVGGCFVAGLVIIGHLVAPAEPQATAPEALRGKDELAARAAFDEYAEEGERPPVIELSDTTPSTALPVDEALGEAEVAPSTDAESKRAARASKRKPVRRVKPKRASQQEKKQIDFGF
jgi:serine/threonine-protein kinase